jgi:hypothetical protein
MSNVEICMLRISPCPIAFLPQQSLYFVSNQNVAGEISQNDNNNPITVVITIKYIINIGLIAG